MSHEVLLLLFVSDIPGFSLEMGVQETKSRDSNSVSASPVNIGRPSWNIRLVFSSSASVKLLSEQNCTLHSPSCPSA
ncbi:hypothetical protein B0H65DRAFT_54848 [Neurospora tetraspora]|uniref:Secreted protein n=1 Tax=Neurospora tetraspora TaxID=94610 RepID=A0AAE0JQ78_9PEZI|nr:hypothetical protein B0H65DRAFT_54848 [Neurospora tetraspora]